MDSVQTIEKKDGFLRLIVFTIVKITCTDKGIQFNQVSKNQEIVPGKFMESSWKIPGKFADFC
jgi:hypothetical protein